MSHSARQLSSFSGSFVVVLGMNSGPSPLLGRCCATEHCLTSRFLLLWGSLHKPFSVASWSQTTSSESNLSTGLTWLERSDSFWRKGKMGSCTTASQSFLGWPWTCCRAQNDLELLVLLFLQEAGVTSMYHSAWFYSVLWIESWASGMIGELSTNRAASANAPRTSWRGMRFTFSGGAWRRKDMLHCCFCLRAWEISVPQFPHLRMVAMTALYCRVKRMKWFKPRVWKGA